MNPFKNLKLTKEEREIEEAIERGDVHSVPDVEKEKARYQRIAKATLDKIKNVNLRLSRRDLHQLKVKAARAGIPYQTLAASVLHRYADDKTRVTL